MVMVPSILRSYSIWHVVTSKKTWKLYMWINSSQKWITGWWSVSTVECIQTDLTEYFTSFLLTPRGSSQLYMPHGRLHSPQTFNRAWNRCHSLKMNTVTENYGLIYASSNGLWPYHVGYYFQSLKTSTPIPCPVDHDDIVPLKDDGSYNVTNNYLWWILTNKVLLNGSYSIGFVDICSFQPFSFWTKYMYMFITGTCMQLFSWSTDLLSFNPFASGIPKVLLSSITGLFSVKIR